MNIKAPDKNRNRRTVTTVIIIFTAVLAAVATISFYLYELNDYVFTTTVANIQELAEHDVKSVEAFLETNWSNLYYAGEKMKVSEHTSITTLQEKLKKECDTSAYVKMYVIDDNGNIYSSDGTVKKIQKDDAEAKLFDSEYGKVVVRNDEVNEKGENEELLMYGVLFDDKIEIDGKNIIGMYAKSSLKLVEDNLRLESFNNRGYSVVFNRSGDLVVNIAHYSKRGWRENFYDTLRNSEIEGDYTVEKFIELNDNNQTYTVKYIDPEGTEKIFLASPVKYTSWTFVIIVPYSVFEEQSSSIFTMILILLVVIITILMVSVIYIFFSYRNMMRVRAEADAKSELLSNMSHEIRTPLNAIIGLNHLMLTHIDDKEKMRDYIFKNNNTAEYLLSLINDILDMSKLQANKMEIDVKPINLELLLDSVCSMEKEKFAQDKIVFRVDADFPYPSIMGDDVRIKQVLMNVLSNAEKFTPSGGYVTLTARQVESYDDKIITVFTIADTGCGMSQEFQEKIFDSFTQERNKNPHSIKGTGLGMSISYMIMQLMDGSISVKSELGEGSTFTIEFPADVCTEETNYNINETDVLKIQNRESFNILLAEDNELNAQILTEIFEDEGLTVAHAKNGREAVDIFAASKENEYDVILMDIQMPVLNGYDACREIRRLDRPDAETIPIFACTANAFKENELLAIESGMNDFITKPVSVDILFAKLSEITSRRDSEEDTGSSSQ